MKLTLISRKLGLERIQWRWTESHGWSIPYKMVYTLKIVNCVPRCSMIENLIQEKHNGGMAGHFGSDKTFGPSWVISIFGQG